MSFPRYPKYKDSGVEWLGEVPEHWTAIPAKRLGRLKAGTGFPHERQGIEGEELSFHKVNALAQADRNGFLLPSENTISRDIAKELGAFVFPRSTIVFAKVGAALLLGRIRVLKLAACLDNNMMGLVVHQNEASVDFLRHAMTLVRFDLIANPGAVPSLNEGQIGDFRLAIPPLSEQAAIAAFLDRETAKIDMLIAEQQRLIELLKEKRQAVISHAVTKGLNPDAPMKDSGIEWLGEVPAHWHVRSFQRCVFVAEGQVDPEDPAYSAMSLIAPNHIESATGRLFELESASDQGAISGKYLCRAGDVVYSKIRPALRKVCLAPGNCLCSADMYPLRAHSGLTNNFLFWWILSEQFSAFAILESQRVAMPKINRESLKEVMLVLPPQKEQQEIADFLFDETKRIDALTTEAQRAIDLLQERRTALISAAVTGQIDIRAAACIDLMEITA